MPEREQMPLETGAELLDQAANFYREFAVLPGSTYADMLAAWAMHTYVFKAWNFTPHLGILSDLPESGKSRVRRLTTLLSDRPKVLEGNYSAPTFVRWMVKKSKTGGIVAMDETDRIFRTENSAPQFQGPFNSSFAWDGTNDKCSGSDEIIEQPIYCPIVFAGLRFLPRACMTRSILVYMEKRKPEQEISKFDPRIHSSWGVGIGQSMGQWAKMNALELSDAMPDLPDGCEDRKAEKWQPLFAIAQVAGHGWLERIHAAYEEITGGIAAEPVLSPLAQLLLDIRKVWTGDRMYSTTLIQRLMVLPGAPYATRWPKDNPLVAKQELATLLRPKGIGPKKMRIEGGDPAAGYERTMFDPLWAEQDASVANQPEHAEQPEHAS
jgi:hypothetical protein